MPKIFAGEKSEITHSFNLYDYNADGNCIYKGYNPEANPGEDEDNWYITRYWYDAEGNCTKKMMRITSWTNREEGW